MAAAVVRADEGWDYHAKVIKLPICIVTPQTVHEPLPPDLGKNANDQPDCDHVAVDIRLAVVRAPSGI